MTGTEASDGRAKRRSGGDGLRRNDAVASLFVYATGTGAFFLLDIFLAGNLSDPALADWALTKSLLFFGAGFCALGVDQALLRRPIGPRQFLPPLMVQATVFALPIAGLAWLAPNPLEPVAVFIAVLALAVLTVLSGSHRAAFRVTASHVTLNLWKLPAAVILASLATLAVRDRFTIALETGVATVLCVWAVAAAIQSLRSRPVRFEAGEYLELLPVGVRFWASAMVSTSISYIDQLLLNFTSTPAASSEFFSYVAVFTPVSVFAVGFLANLINPYLRSQGNAIRAGLVRAVTVFGLVGFAVVVVSSVVGFVIASQLDRFSDGLDPNLVAIMLLLSALRFSYVGPSAFLGVFGSRQDLSRLIVGSLASLPVLVGAYFVLIELGVSAPRSAGVALVLAATLRVAWAVRLSVQIVRSERRLELSL